jgi:hypothetical protein
MGPLEEPTCVSAFEIGIDHAVAPGRVEHLHIVQEGFARAQEQNLKLFGARD